MYLKSALFLLIQIGLYVAMMSDHFSAPTFILLYIAFGLATGFVNFNIGHDALHNAFSSNSSVNRILGYIYDINGTSSYVWKVSHNMIHHTYTNIPGHDGDIDKAIILRLNPKDKLYPFQYYQNIYAFLLYGFVAANWIFYADYAHYIEDMKKGKTKTKDNLIFFGFKALNFFLLILLPMLWLHYPIWVILVAYLCAQMATGITISIIFQLAHVVENVSYVEPDDTGVIHNNWAAHEMMTTSNFGTNNWFLTQLIGGLNFQVEHHLFPSICHVHYPEIQNIIKETSREFNLPYNENPTFFKAVASHYRMLKRLGREESSQFLVKDADIINP